MGKPNFSDEFKRQAVTQITERGYPVAEVSERLRLSQHSLHTWKRHLAKEVSGTAGKDAKINVTRRCDLLPQFHPELSEKSSRKEPNHGC